MPSERFAIDREMPPDLAQEGDRIAGLGSRDDTVIAEHAVVGSL
jgi:hypothetical protein